MSHLSLHGVVCRILQFEACDVRPPHAAPPSRCAQFLRCCGVEFEQPPFPVRRLTSSILTAISSFPVVSKSCQTCRISCEVCFVYLEIPHLNILPLERVPQIPTHLSHCVIQPEFVLQDPLQAPHCPPWGPPWDLLPLERVPPTPSFPTSGLAVRSSSTWSSPPSTGPTIWQPSRQAQAPAKPALKFNLYMTVNRQIQVYLELACKHSAHDLAGIQASSVLCMYFHMSCPVT